MKKIPKGKKGAWFVKFRGSYIPCSRAGWLTYIPFTATLLIILAWAIDQCRTLIDSAPGSSSAELFWHIGIFYAKLLVLFIIPGIVMTWIASKKS